MTQSRAQRRARGLAPLLVWLDAVTLAQLDELVGRRGRARWVREQVRAALAVRT